MKSIALACMAALLAALLSPAAEAGSNSHSYVSASGLDTNGCTLSSPCLSIRQALGATASGGIVSCLDSKDFSDFVGTTIAIPVTIDCGGVAGGGTAGPFTVNGSGIEVTIKNLTINGASIGELTCIALTEAATLVNCAATALQLEPTTASSVVVSNSAMTNSAAGVLIKPASGGSVAATFDHVKITQNSGGGIRVDTTSGGVTVDATDSVVSNNGGTGINALGNAGGQAIVSIENSVIARNGGAGVQANGVNAGVLIATTLLDQNAVGATSVVNGGNMFTYGNNQIVGPIGSGFNQTAQLQ